MEEKNSSKISFLLKDITDLNAEFAITGIGGSEAMYKRVLDMVIGMLPTNIAEMDKFLKEEDNLGDFTIRVHGVKSSLRQVGCYRLGDLADALEKAGKANDRQYCDMNYGAFREEVLRFYEQVNSVLRNMGNKAGSCETPSGDINDYIDVLTRVKEAAMGYDSILAMKRLSPVLKFHFSVDIDELLKKAATEFEAYRPRKGLVHITELLNKYQKLSQLQGKDGLK